MVDDNREWFIYVLRDPRDNDVRYVGWTIDVEQRFMGHISHSAKETGYKANWIKSLLQLNMKPAIQIIDRGFGDKWAEVEMYWILHYRMQGARLTNMTDGGEGTLGRKLSPETKEKIRNVAQGRKYPPERIEMMRGRKLSPEHIEKIRQSALGKKRSFETCERISKAKLGRTHSAQSKENMSLAQLARKMGIAVRRVEDGAVFMSISEAAYTMNRSDSSILQAIVHNGKCANYHWEYADNIHKRKWQVTVIRIEDETVFKSLSAAARSVDGAISSMCRAIKTGRKYLGYHWRYADTD